MGVNRHAHPSLCRPLAWQSIYLIDLFFVYFFVPWRRQNRLSDVFSLLKFLRAEPFCFWSYWNAHVEAVFLEDQAAAFARVQAALAPLLLRRTKETLGSDGAPILKLPSIDVATVMLEFDAAERDFYCVRDLSVFMVHVSVSVSS